MAAVKCIFGFDRIFVGEVSFLPKKKKKRKAREAN